MPGLMHKLCVLAAHWVREAAPERERERERERREKGGGAKQSMLPSGFEEDTSKRIGPVI